MIIILEGHSDYDTHMRSVKVRSSYDIYLYLTSSLNFVSVTLTSAHNILSYHPNKYHGFHTAKK